MATVKEKWKEFTLEQLLKGRIARSAGMSQEHGYVNSHLDGYNAEQLAWILANLPAVQGALTSQHTTHPMPIVPKFGSRIPSDSD